MDHFLDVVRGADQRELAVHPRLATHPKTPETRVLDLPEHRFHDHLAAAVDRAALRPRHALVHRPPQRLPAVARHRARRPGLRPATAIMISAGRANFGLAPILAPAPGVRAPQRQELAAGTMKAVPRLVVAKVRLHQGSITVFQTGLGRLLAAVRRDVRLHSPVRHRRQVVPRVIAVVARRSSRTCSTGRWGCSICARR